MGSINIMDFDEDDLKLILTCLDNAIVEKGQRGLITALTETIVPEDMKRSTMFINYKKEALRRDKANEAEDEIRNESIKILYGKILSLKRKRQEDAAVDFFKNKEKDSI